MPTCTVNSQEDYSKMQCFPNFFFFFYRANLLRGCFIKGFLNCIIIRYLYLYLSGSRQFYMNLKAIFERTKYLKYSFLTMHFVFLFKNMQ